VVGTPRVRTTFGARTVEEFLVRWTISRS